MDVIEIKPEELFFLAKCMKAKYIDYSYIKDISGQEKSELDVNETINSLENKEYVFAGFDGTVEIDDDVSVILQPVFFGKTEIKLIAGDMQINYHVSESCTTVCKRSDDLFTFSRIVERPNPGNNEKITEIVIQIANVDKGYQRKEFLPEQIDHAWEYITSEIEKGR